MLQDEECEYQASVREARPVTIGALGWILIALSAATTPLELFDDPIIDTGKQVLETLLMLLAVLLAIARYRPSDPRPWKWLAVSTAFVLVFTLYYFVPTLINHQWNYDPGDLLDFLPSLAASVTRAGSSILIMRDRRPRGDWALADAWVIGIGVLLALIRWISIPLFLSEGTTLATLNIGVVSAVCDTLTLVPLTAILFSEPINNRGFQLYFLGTAIHIFSAAFFFAVHGVTVFSGLAKTSALLAANVGRVIRNAGILHPSMREITDESKASRAEWNWWRTTAILASVSAPIAMDFSLQPIPHAAHQWFLVGIGILLIAIIIRLRVAVLAASKVEEALRTQVHQDELTGLPNRRYLNDVFAKELEAAVPGATELALACCYVDVDNLKDVNDRNGHQNGDALIRVVAEAIRKPRSSEHSVAARVGGDEFLVIAAVDERNAEVETTRFATGVLAAIKGATWNSDIGQTSASVGAAWHLICGTEGSVSSQLNRLIDHADLAQVEAKRSGGGRVRYFQAELSTRARRHTSINRHIGEAWARREMYLEYQPVVGLTDRRIYGAESLLRWQHPLLGSVQPPEAIRAAEQLGMISTLGLDILDAALADIASMQAEAPIRVGVNLSGHQLRPEHLEKIMERIDTSALGKYLWLEITEQELVENRQIAARALCELRKMGVVVAIDDFGTGYCGLDYLCTLPVDIVKLDGIFARECPKSETRRKVTQLGVRLAESIGAVTLAEGIESEETAALMRSLGCTYGQGYWFRRPVGSLRAATQPV